MKKIFCWVRDSTILASGRYAPQIVHDPELMRFLEKEKHLTIVYKQELGDQEANLSLNELALKYPAPKLPDD